MFFSAPRRAEITPDELAGVIANRPTPAGDYFGAVTKQSFDYSFPGAVYNEALVPDDDRVPLPPQFRSGRQEYKRTDVPIMSEDQWKASEWYREAIPFDNRMTQARARAKAEIYDADQYNTWLRQNREMSASTAALAVTGSLLGAAPDPTNYIPVFGPAFKAANAARMANILRRAGVAAFDSAIVTAAVSPMVAQSRRQFGDDVSFADILLDIGLSAALGGALGGVVGWRERLSAHNPELAQAALQAIGEGAESLAQGQDINVGPAVRRIESVRTKRLMGGSSLSVDPTFRPEFAPIKPSTAKSPIQVDVPMLNKAGEEMVFDNLKAAKKAVSNAKRQGAQLSVTDVGDGTYRVTQSATVEVLDHFVDVKAAEAEAKRIPPKQREGIEVVPLIQEDGTTRHGLVRGLTPSQANMARANPEMLRNATNRAEVRESIPQPRPFPTMVLDAWTGPRKPEPNPYPWMQRAERINDTSPAPRPSTPAAALAKAEASIGRKADAKTEAEGLGVDSSTGDFPELADIERLKKSGSLSPTEVESMKAADDLMKTAENYAKAYEAAAACLSRVR